MLDSIWNRLFPQAHCCGIIGHAGKNGGTDKILADGILLLQSRGYDSCGIATCNDSKLTVTKYASKITTGDCIKQLRETINSSQFHKSHNIGIAHTRWATHGGKTNENAHPHSDWKNRIALVHNGTIDNFLLLKNELIKLNPQIIFQSETDSEVIANLIGYYLDHGYDFQSSVRRVCETDLRGTWGLCIIHKDFDDLMMVARNGSPLLLGSSDDEIFVASEPLAIARYTNKYITMNDGEVLCISKTNGIKHLVSGDRQFNEIHITPSSLELTPAPYTHWTLKEIYEQQDSIWRALNYGARINGTEKIVRLGGLDSKKNDMLRMQNIVLTGCGTSLYAALYGQLIMRRFRCFQNVHVIDSSEFDAHSIPLPLDSSGVLLISQSGETRDVISACEVAENNDVQRFSVVNTVGSMLARKTSCGVYLNAGREVGVASTKAFTSQVVVLSMVAAWFLYYRNHSEDELSAGQNIGLSVARDDTIWRLADSLHRLPATVRHTLATTEPLVKEIAVGIKDCETLFVLGKGYGYPVALEGALKIKEISYIHAEGFAGGQLKHGPYALIDKDKRTPVILLLFNDMYKSFMLNVAIQIVSRGARIIVITDTDIDHTDLNITDTNNFSLIKIPSCGEILTPMISIVPLQFIAYHLSILRGHDPDLPRGLAKTVTVS